MSCDNDKTYEPCSCGCGGSSDCTCDCNECAPVNCIEQAIRDALATLQEQLEALVKRAEDAAKASEDAAAASAASAAEAKDYRDAAELAATTATDALKTITDVAVSLEKTAKKLQEIADELATAIAGIAVVTWYYTAVSEGQTVIPVPDDKNALAVQCIYIEGARQEPGRGFVFDKTAKTITLAEGIPLGLEISIILGTYSDNPTDFPQTLASSNGASLIGTTSGQTVQQNLNAIDADLIKLKLNWAIENGYSDSGLTFTTGGTLTANDRNKVVYDPVSELWYSWAGTLPHTFAAETNPVGVSDWVSQGDPKLRADLNTAASGKGADLVKFKTGASVQRLVDSDGFNIIGKFDQVADLRSLTASPGTTVLVKEHTIGRGALGGGQFVAVASTIADDDGVYISSGTTGVTWVRKDAGSHVKIEWFGGKSEDFSIDHSPILANAQKSEGRSIEFQYGTYCFTFPCTIKPTMHFIGAGGARTFWRNKNLTDSNLFRADTGTQSNWATNTIFERIHFSNGMSAPVTNAVLIMLHITLFKFINCGFYNAPIYASNLHWVTWSGCQFIDSPVRIDEQQVSPTFPINEGPSFIDCYMVRSPIDIVDVADLHLNGTSMFYGPYGIKSTAHRPLDSGATSRGFPMMITNSTIDNIDGYCLDLNRVALGTITNSFFSGGRVSNTPAIRATEILGLSFNGNVIHFSGQECMTLYDTENMLMGNNQFSGCNGFAIKAQYSRNNVLNGNYFGTQKVSGGWNTCTGGVNFDTNDNLAWQITGNIFGGGIPGVAGQVGTGRTVYRATGNAGLADN